MLIYVLPQIVILFDGDNMQNIVLSAELIFFVKFASQKVTEAMTRFGVLSREIAHLTQNRLLYLLGKFHGRETSRT